jgi:transglutaminase-like putative cysteine protease
MVPSDPLRWIHWKSTAKQNKFFVRQFEGTPAGDWWVLLDLDKSQQLGIGWDSTEEHSVILASSLASQGLNEEHPVGLALNGHEPAWIVPRRNEYQQKTLLKALAVADPSELNLKDYLGRIGQTLGSRSSLLIITSNPSAEWTESILPLMWRGVMPTVFVLEPRSYGGASQTRALEDALQMLGVPCHVIPKELLDARQIRPGHAGEWEWRISGTGKAMAEARMIVRMARRLFSAEAMGLILVAFSLQIFTYGVSSSLRGTDTRYFFYVCLIAVLIGLGLEKSKSKAVPASAGIVALGVTGVWILGARIAQPLLVLLQSITALFPQIIPAIRFETNLDTTAIAEAWTPIVDASVTLMLRFQTWLAGFDRNVVVNDVLIRNLVWLLLLWLIAAWMGWFTARRNAVAALTPSIFVLALVTSYSEFKVETIWALVFVMLLLMGVWNYKNHTQQWETRKVDYSESIRYDNTQAVLFLAIAICSVAFITPSLSWREIRDYLRERNSADSEAAEVLGIQQQSVAVKNVAAQKPSLPRDHLLSGGNALSQEIVMTIRTGELPPIPDLSFAGEVPRYYWRSTIYDEYMGSGWVTSLAPPQRFKANTPLIPGLLNGYKAVHLDVELVQPVGKLFWSGTLFSADVPLRVDWRLKPQSNLFADQATLLQADMFTATTSATAYKAESYIPDVSIAELRATSDEYPENILDRYLVLPRSVPGRVRRLAENITRGKTNPYDKAKAIEVYLRANYPYDLEVPAPPPDQDVADYFLFDLKKGYCDYFATSMVVMARAAGIPARFVSGYSPGAYDAPNAQYIVRELNAHSWAEVYFTGIGWVEFEPTGSIPEIVRSEADETTTPEQEPDSAAARLLTRFRLEKLTYFLLPLFIVVVITLVYFTLIERWWVLRMKPSIAIENIYRKLYRAGRPFVGIHMRAETSHEFAEKLADKLIELAEGSRFEKLLADIKNNTMSLTGLYDSALFIDVQVQKQDARTAWHTWTQLRWRLLFARILLAHANRIQKANRAHLQAQHT